MSPSSVQRVAFHQLADRHAIFKAYETRVDEENVADQHRSTETATLTVSELVLGIMFQLRQQLHHWQHGRVPIDLLIVAARQRAEEMTADDSTGIIVDNHK